MPDEFPDQPETPTTRRLRRRPFAVLVAVVAVIAGLVSGGVALSQSTPKHGDSIPNITLVENQIKAYYGDTVAGTDHLPSATGNYAEEVEGIAGQAQQYLSSRGHQDVNGKPALVFDVDDTTLNTYNYEIFSGFAYNPVTNAEYVNDERFPAVFGMPALVNWANSHGYTVFFLTGRPEAQRAGTQGNLAKVGYQAPADTAHLYLKDQTVPWLSFCAPNCTTIQYKSSTRAHIESLGYDIVADFGD